MKTSEAYKNHIESLKMQVSNYEKNILEIGVKIGKLAAKGKLEDVKSQSWHLNFAIDQIKKINEIKIPELVEEMEEAERQETGLGKISDVLNELFEDDMKFYFNLINISTKELKQKISDGTFPKSYITIHCWNESQARKEFKRDLQDRFTSLKNKVIEKVGLIQDIEIKRNASNGFDGFVKGEKGNARVETIVAGGYNIQRAHVRTLVNLI